MKIILALLLALVGSPSLLPANSRAAEYEVLKDASSGRPFALRLPAAERRTGPVSPAATPLTESQSSAIADAFVAKHGELLGVPVSAGELRRDHVDLDATGTARVVYQQRHLGLEVFAGEVHVHLAPGGAVEYVKFKLGYDLPASIVPTLTAARGVEAALAAAERDNAAGANLAAGQPELLILPLDVIQNLLRPDARLTWRVRVEDEDSGDRFSRDFFVDAGTGEILLALPNIHGLDRRVYDCYPKPTSPSCVLDVLNTDFPTPPYYHGRSEAAPRRGPHPDNRIPVYGSVEVDSLHALLGGTHSYAQTQFGIDGANARGGTGYGTTGGGVPFTQTRGFAHSDPVSSFCPRNATFNSTNGNMGWCIGMVVPDIVGHEYGHSIEFHSFYIGNAPIGYVYSGQTASLVEGSADIFGEGFERSFLGFNDWLISPTSSAGLIRNIAHPSSRVNSTSGRPYPESFTDSTFYCGSGDSGGAHTNSTVLSHAFYLIAEGGVHNNCIVVGQGMAVAQQILFRSWRTYFSRTVTFNEAYTDIIQAATDLYGAPVVESVTHALQAARMDQPGFCSGQAGTPPACANPSAVAELPDGGRVDQLTCQPNPTTGVVHVRYTTARSGRVALQLFDVAGRLVDELNTPAPGTGWQEVEFRIKGSASGPPSGLYFLKLTVDAVPTAARRIVVTH